jgi:hypothetical protein
LKAFAKKLVEHTEARSAPIALDDLVCNFDRNLSFGADNQEGGKGCKSPNLDDSLESAPVIFQRGAHLAHADTKTSHEISEQVNHRNVHGLWVKNVRPIDIIELASASSSFKFCKNHDDSALTTDSNLLDSSEQAQLHDVHRQTLERSQHTSNDQNQIRPDIPGYHSSDQLPTKPSSPVAACNIQSASENLKRLMEQREMSLGVAAKLTMVIHGRSIPEWEVPMASFAEDVQMLEKSISFCGFPPNCRLIEWQMTEMKSVVGNRRSRLRIAMPNVPLPIVVVCFCHRSFMEFSKNLSNLEKLLKQLSEIYSKDTRIEILVTRFYSRFDGDNGYGSASTSQSKLSTKGVTCAKIRSTSNQQNIEPCLTAVAAFLLQQHGVDLICVEDTDQARNYLVAVSRSLLTIPFEPVTQPDGVASLRFAAKETDLQLIMSSSLHQQKRSMLAERRAETALETENQHSTIATDPTRSSDKRQLMEHFLAAVPRVSAGAAKAISSEYSSLRALYRAYESCSDEGARQKLLSNIYIQGGSGSAGTRRLGPALSNILYQVLWLRRGEHVLHIN